MRVSRHLGVVAVSPEGAALLYRRLMHYCGCGSPDAMVPRVTIHSEPFGAYVRAIRGQDWHAVAELLAKSARLLEAAGADLCLCPDHSVLHAMHLAEPGSPVPWLNMAELVAEAVRADGRQAVGILGTKLVTQSAAYQTHLGIRGVRMIAPDADEADELERIVFEELVYGRLEARTRAWVIDLLSRLRDRGCEGVILGTSEAPLLIQPGDSPVPLYDATDLLAIGGIRFACGGVAA
ncbi:MAG: amino acid racemase [Phycisphaerales bacterium]|jgi:aspartate racemase|nr:amino acid racemase [Phycisphaerales bacterium]